MPSSRRDFVKATLAAGVAAASGEIAAAEAKLQGEPAAPPATTVPISEEFTRGIGIYPGAAEENVSPTLIPAGSDYRNLALLRPAFHSSSYDYNLTAQLVTDGIKHDHKPEFINVSVDGRVLARPEREVILDHFQSSVLEVIGASPVIDFHLAGGVSAPKIDRIGAFVVVSDKTDRSKLTFTAFGSADGYLWRELGKSDAKEPVSGENYPPDLARGNALLTPSIAFARPEQLRYYRLQLSVANASADQYSAHWGLGEVEFSNAGSRVEVGGPYSFTSAWKSEGLGEEWVYVDLGVGSTFDRVALHWIAPAREGKLQVSNDATNWRTLNAIHGATSKEEIVVAPAAHGRFVRVLMTQPASADGYILSELEVFGRGGLTTKSKPIQAPTQAGDLHLAGGNWRVQRANLVSVTGSTLSQTGYKDEGWVVATVPGTVLTSYLNAGAIPDPNYGQNQLYVSDSYFYSDFWYRTEFPSPPSTPGELQWLEFDGINWKANIYLNGERLGRIEGAFQRARYNVTGKLRTDAPNALAVLIEKNATPGSAKQKTLETPGRNGGALGADNPTFHSSIGWDWIPTIRGRNTGIWNSVRLTQTTTVTVSNPALTTVLPVPDNSRADVAISVQLHNHGNAPVAGSLRCRFGEFLLEQKISLGGGEQRQITFNKQSHQQLALQNPRLWWPVGYGEPSLHDVEMTYHPDDGGVSKPLQFRAGLRQITANEEGGALRLFVNGRRIVAKGGNWGFSESMLRYRAREYDAAVRYHREMNFNMIRNWVGQIGEDAFYEACDRHGVLVWQDFWLANPWDGPIPNDNAMFLANARDLLLRIRSHASIGIYCGRNEWFPPKPLDDGLRALLKELHPDIHYIGSSADGPVSGHGPYQALLPQKYFRIADTKLHSEIGSPNIPTYDSVRAMMPENALWPQSLVWGLHDFCLKGAQGGESFRSIIDQSYGGANSASEWIELAQFVNYDTYRAMFEAQSKYRMGLLLWMTHPCWPSFVWQTYDYYLEPTAAYFGCKKACEPLHIQWNPVTNTIEVVNTGSQGYANLTANLQILGSNGAVLGKQSASVVSHDDSTVDAFAISYPESLPAIHFLSLALTASGKSLSTNFYMRGSEIEIVKGIRALPKAKVTASTSTARTGDSWRLITKLSNSSGSVALMVRVKAVRSHTGDRILPAIFSDNYIALFPREEKTIQTDLRQADARGETPRIVVEGFNIAT